MGILIKFWDQKSGKGDALFSGCDITEKLLLSCMISKTENCCFISCCSLLKKDKSLNIHHKSICPHKLTNLYLSLTWEPLHGISITPKVIFHICLAYTDRDVWRYSVLCTKTWGNTYSYLLGLPSLNYKPSPNHECIISCSEHISISILSIIYIEK